MLGNIELMERWFEQVKVLVQASIQNKSARGGVKLKGPCEEEHDVLMYGDGMKPQYGIVEFKKRRGVSLMYYGGERKAHSLRSELQPQADATAVIGSTHLSGGAVRMVPGRSAMPAACITPSRRGNDSLKRGQFVRHPKDSGYEVHSLGLGVAS